MRHDPEQIRRQYRISAVAPRYGVALKKDGREWIGLCPFHNEDTPSFTVFPGKGGADRFHCFGCGEGGDVIDLVSYLTGKPFVEALTEIAGEAPPSPSRAKIDKPDTDGRDPYSDYSVVIPPANATKLLPGVKTPRLLNPKRIDDEAKRFAIYTPTLVHPYHLRDGRLFGYVLRIDTSDGRKFTPSIVWMKNPKTGFSGWSHGAFPTPRPIYGLNDLIERPEAQVLIVEGEKCRDAAATLDWPKPGIVPVSWCGGAKAWHLTKWEPLAGRSVIVWMDNDPQGEAAFLGDYDKRGEWRLGVTEELLRLECKIKIITRPGPARPDGWDIADAIADSGWSAQEALLYMRAERGEWNADRLALRKADRRPPPKEAKRELKPTAQAKPFTAEKDAGTPARAGPREIGDNVVSLHGGPVDAGPFYWRGQLILKPDGDTPRPKSMENYRLFATYHEQLTGLFAFNTFASLIYVMRPPPWEKPNGPFEMRQMTDNDIVSLVGYLERFQLMPGVNDLGKAVQVAAMEHKFNPITDYLDGLQWDRVPRLQGGQWEGESVTPFLAEYFGAENNEINRIFGMRFLISAVARGYKPGCKVDTMLILESPQGYGKSSALRVLATMNDRSFFTDDIQDMHSKDTDLVLQGMLIAEVAELAAFSRTEYNQVKKFMSKQVARFRPPYGKNPQDFPRSSIFVGTVNPGQSGYLRDPTGARRYWPVRCADVIDLDRIAADRAQLWAEATHLYRQGEQWWLNPSEEKLADPVQRSRYEDDPWKDRVLEITAGEREVKVDMILTQLLVPIERRTPLVAKKVIDILAMEGWTKHVTRRGMSGPTYTVMRSPETN